MWVSGMAWVIRSLKLPALVLVMILAGGILPEPGRSAALSTGPIEWDGTLRRVHVPILMYHHVSVLPANADKYRLDLTVTPEDFTAQMQYLADEGYHTITPDQLAGALLRGDKLPPKPVMLTFDDGYDDAFSVAFPILQRFEATGTFFIISDFVDEREGGYLTWDEAKKMAAGGMAIEDHTRDHKDMRNRSRDWLDGQIVPSRDRIEAMTGSRPVYFCYPSGQYDGKAIEEVRAAGFVMAFTTNDGTYSFTDNMLRLPRVRIRGTTTLAAFAKLLAWER